MIPGVFEDDCVDAVEGPAVGWVYEGRGAGRATGAAFLAGEEDWTGAGRAAWVEGAGRKTGTEGVGRDTGAGVGRGTGGRAACGGGRATGGSTGRGRGGAIGAGVDDAGADASVGLAGAGARAGAAEVKSVCAYSLGRPPVESLASLLALTLHDSAFDPVW